MCVEENSPSQLQLLPLIQRGSTGFAFFPQFNYHACQPLLYVHMLPLAIAHPHTYKHTPTDTHQLINRLFINAHIQKMDAFIFLFSNKWESLGSHPVWTRHVQRHEKDDAVNGCREHPLGMPFSLSFSLSFSISEDVNEQKEERGVSSKTDRLGVVK